ncbi:MAG: Bax inhibitor-1 family protein [Lysobacterales bacterium]|nr:Bax inhibitor-1 family protein [Rhodanobacteraceae bacterium]
MSAANPVLTRAEVAALANTKTIRNAYTLLTMILGLSAVTCWYAISSGATPINVWLFLAFMIGMPFAVNATRNSMAGLVLSFVYAAGLGYFLGPIVGIYLSIDPNIPVYALAATSVIFFSLSGYALVSRTNFNFMGGFLFVGSLVILGAIVANIFLQMPVLSLVISGAAVLLISGAILWETSQLIHDPEANYIVIATSLLGSIWVLFMHLMRLFAFFSGED